MLHNIYSSKEIAEIIGAKVISETLQLIFRLKIFLLIAGD